MFELVEEEPPFVETLMLVCGEAQQALDVLSPHHLTYFCGGLECHASDPDLAGCGYAIHKYKLQTLCHYRGLCIQPSNSL
jgi:hypothetical protein